MLRYIFSLFFCLMLLGCNEKELESLRAENLRHKNEIQTLKDEVEKLHQTAEYNFRLGQDYLTDKNWDSAIEAFNTVIKKYPDSSLVLSAEDALAAAKSERDKHLKEIAEKKKIADEKKEKELLEVGEPIDYGKFYAKSKMGMKYGKRYRFYACVSPGGSCIMNQEIGRGQDVCGIEAQFDYQDEYEEWLSSGERHCGIIVASMMRGAYGGTVVVHRLH